MSERITRRHLDGLVRILNGRVGFDPDEPLWRTETDADGSRRNVATIGMYEVDGAYGGWSLQRVMSEGGGVTDIFRVGHVPARELYGLIRAYLDGMDAAEQSE